MIEPSQHVILGETSLPAVLNQHQGSVGRIEPEVLNSKCVEGKSTGWHDQQRKSCHRKLESNIYIYKIIYNITT